jgi:hypothetical protein
VGSRQEPRRQSSRPPRVNNASVQPITRPSAAAWHRPALICWRIQLYPQPNQRPSSRVKSRADCRLRITTENLFAKGSPTCLFRRADQGHGAHKVAFIGYIFIRSMNRAPWLQVSNERITAQGAMGLGSATGVPR